MTPVLRVPCTYQGGKQRVAQQIVDILLAAAKSPTTRYYDLCCGSGAVTIELVNRGVHPSRITMLDVSSWGVFWSSIGKGSFDMKFFNQLLSEIPSDKREIKDHLTRLSSIPINEHEAELYPLLQAGSFGGKQIWRENGTWSNAFFRNYWEPTATSIRRSPANPIQPSPSELHRRIALLSQRMIGVTSFNFEIMNLLDYVIPDDSVVYVDPPYRNTTGYAFGFDTELFANLFRAKSQAPLFVSEGGPLTERASMLVFGGANGGISGMRRDKHQEWISEF